MWVYWGIFVVISGKILPLLTYDHYRENDQLEVDHWIQSDLILYWWWAWWSNYCILYVVDAWIDMQLVKSRCMNIYKLLRYFLLPLLVKYYLCSPMIGMPQKWSLGFMCSWFTRLWYLNVIAKVKVCHWIYFGKILLSLTWDWFDIIRSPSSKLQWFTWWNRRQPSGSEEGFFTAMHAGSLVVMNFSRQRETQLVDLLPRFWEGCRWIGWIGHCGSSGFRGINMRCQKIYYKCCIQAAKQQCNE